MKALFLSIFGVFFFVSLFAWIYGHDFKSIGEVFVYLTERLPLDEAKSFFDWIFGDLFSYAEVESSTPSLTDQYGFWYEGIDFSKLWNSIVDLFDGTESNLGDGGFGAR